MPKKQKRPPKALRGKQSQRLVEANRGLPETADDNRRKAFELRKQKLTYREIGERIGVSVATAYLYVTEYWQEIKDITDDEAKMLRSNELATLDELERRWFPLAIAPELDVSKVVQGGNGRKIHIHLDAYDAGLKAVDRVLKIQERRAKLLGLEAPQEIKLSGHLTLDELQNRMARAKSGPASP